MLFLALLVLANDNMGSEITKMGNANGNSDQKDKLMIMFAAVRIRLLLFSDNESNSLLMIMPLVPAHNRDFS